MILDGDNEQQDMEPDENLELPKETLEDLEAPDATAEEAKGGGANRASVECPPFTDRC